jgi:hypothetical protein
MTLAILRKYATLFVTKYGFSKTSLENELKMRYEHEGHSNTTRWNFINAMFEWLLAEFDKVEQDIFKRLYAKRDVYSDIWNFYLDSQRNFNSVQKARNYNELLIANDGDWKTKVEVIGKFCPESENIDGKLFEIEDALKEQPIPLSNCSRKAGCICQYAAIAVRDENDRLVHK